MSDNYRVTILFNAYDTNRATRIAAIASEAILKEMKEGSQPVREYVYGSALEHEKEPEWMLLAEPIQSMMEMIDRKDDREQ